MDIKIWGRFVGHWYHKSWGVLCSSECVYQMYIVYLLLVCLHSHGISSRRWTKWNFFWAENTFRIRVRSKEKCQANIFLIKSFAWEWESDELNWEWRRRFFFSKSSPASPVRVCTRPSAVPMLARNPLHPTHPIARASVPRPFHPRLPREPVQLLPDFHPFLALLFCPPWCLPTNATAVLLLAHAGAQKKDDQLDIIASLTCASFARN